MSDVWGELFRCEFPDYTDEQIHDLIDHLEELVSDASAELFQTVCEQARNEEQYADKGGK